jgi:hypothetical protein
MAAAVEPEDADESAKQNLSKCILIRFIFYENQCYGSAYIICGSGSKLLDECGSGSNSRSGSKSKPKISNFFPNVKIFFMLSLNYDTFKQFIQTSLSKICFHTLSKICMMNFLSFGSVFSSVLDDFGLIRI